MSMDLERKYNSDHVLYKNGTEFLPIGKRTVETVVDSLRTYNMKNELVDLKYVSTHVELGKTLTTYDVPRATVARGIDNLAKSVAKEKKKKR